MKRSLNSQKKNFLVPIKSRRQISFALSEPWKRTDVLEHYVSCLSTVFSLKLYHRGSLIFKLKIGFRRCP